jgi:hypothetical protein
LVLFILNFDSINFIDANLSALLFAMIYDLKKTDKVKHILEICKHRPPSSWDFDLYTGSAGWGVWSWTIYGLDIVSKDNVSSLLENHALLRTAKNKYNKIDYNNKIQSIDVLKNKEFLHKLINKTL